MAEFDREMLTDFLDESGSYLETLNADLLSLEKSLKEPVAGDEMLELLNRMFRAAHSLKGMSGMLGFTRINQLTHKMESVLDGLRSGKLLLRADIVDALFGCFDLLASLVGGVSQNEAEDEQIDISEMVSLLLSLIESTKTEEESQAAEGLTLSLRLSEDVRARITEEEELELFVAEHSGSPIYELTLEFGRDMKLKGVDRSVTDVYREIEKLGDIPVTLNIIVEESGASGRLVLISNHSLDEVRNILAIPDLVIRDVRPDVSEPEAPAAPPAAGEHGLQKDKYTEMFLADTNEAVERMQNLLLEIHPKPDEATFQESIGALFRDAHNIKSSAAAVGFNEISTLAHRMESLFSDLRSGNRDIAEEGVEALLGCVDAMKHDVAAAGAGRRENACLEAVHALERFMTPGKPPLAAVAPLPKISSPAAALTSLQLARLDDVAAEGVPIYEITVTLERKAPMKSMRALLVKMGFEGKGAHEVDEGAPGEDGIRRKRRMPRGNSRSRRASGRFGDHGLPLLRGLDGIRRRSPEGRQCL